MAEPFVKGAPGFVDALNLLVAEVNELTERLEKLEKPKPATRKTATTK